MDNALEAGGREGEGVTREQESRMRENSQASRDEEFQRWIARTKAYQFVKVPERWLLIVCLLADAPTRESDKVRRGKRVATTS